MDSHGLADSQALPLIDYVSWLKYQLITLHGIPLQQSREPFTASDTSENIGGYSYKCENEPWKWTWKGFKYPFFNLNFNLVHVCIAN